MLEHLLVHCTFRMVALCCDVLQIYDSSEWEASDDEGWDSANKEEKAAQIIPLDHEQFDADDNKLILCQ